MASKITKSASAKKVAAPFDCVRDVQPVFGVGRIDDDPAVTDESIAIGITGMALELRCHAPSSDFIASARLEGDEFYRGAEGDQTGQGNWAGLAGGAALPQRLG